MKLERVDVRFFKSFNYDYELKARTGSEPEWWEDSQDGWFPFVKVRVEPSVTAVVGANEAGKSQLLHAIEAAVTGAPIDRADFCRYSSLYSVQSGEMRAPEFGAHFRIEPHDDGEVLASIHPALTGGNSFTLYRPGEDPPFLLVSGEQDKIELTKDQASKLTSALPRIFKLRTDLAIPNDMSIGELAGRGATPLSSRQRRARAFRTLGERKWSAAEELSKVFFPIWTSLVAQSETDEERKRREEFALGKQLLIDIARIDEQAFVQLADALERGHEGQVEGLVGAMNAAIAENLNFQRWWTQDRHFDLRLEAREHELAFTIRDRTNSKYSFDERSQGLRFFLSYFVQLTAHRAHATSGDILLLDEPDAYLSSQGQQDLLRVLDDYSTPEVSAHRNQVVYVTHSPFLINRNAGERIRVLDKGTEDEGTRVVKDIARSHYEPLRSSLGSYVAETAFIGGSNLFVEGLADQVLLAGFSNHLNRWKPQSEVLDLNEVTIVPSGSADSIPYMVYLARGRDQVKPACVALLDGDEAGVRAAELLRRGPVHKRPVIDSKYVIRIDEWAATAGLPNLETRSIREIEDLIAPQLAVDAAQAHAFRVTGVPEENLGSFSLANLQAQIDNKGELWSAVQTTYLDAYPGGHIEKVGFSKMVIAVLGEHIDRTPRKPGHGPTEDRFATLLSHLGDLLRSAMSEEAERQNNSRLDRVIRAFNRDHPQGISKHRARSLLRDVERILDDSDASERVRLGIASIRRRFDLNRDSSDNVGDFETFKQRVQALRLAERLANQDPDDETKAPVPPPTRKSRDRKDDVARPPVTPSS